MENGATVERYRFIDTGSAQEYFAYGLHDVEIAGQMARFILYTLRQQKDGQDIAEPAFHIVLPLHAVGPGIALTLQRCGSLILPMVGNAARQFLPIH